MAAVVAENMNTPKAVVVEWIEHILERKNTTGTDLARKSNVAPSTILRLLNDPEYEFIPSLKTLQKIAEGSGYPIPRKVMAALSGYKEASAAAEREEKMAERRQARTPMVPLRHVSSLPAALQSASKSNRDSAVAAPPQLEGDETAFAFHLPDDTFDPWMKSGTLCFATKRRDPVSGDTVMITGTDGKTRVRLLMGIDESGMRLSKTHPAKEDEVLEFEKITEIAVVVIFVKVI